MQIYANYTRTEAFLIQKRLYTEFPEVLERWNFFRQIDELTYLEYPEWTAKEVSHFLHA